TGGCAAVVHAPPSSGRAAAARSRAGAGPRSPTTRGGRPPASRRPARADARRRPSQPHGHRLEARTGKARAAGTRPRGTRGHGRRRVEEIIVTSPSIPLGDVRALSVAASRTRWARLALAAGLLACAAVAYMVARAPIQGPTPLLPPGSRGIIVLDLSS